VTNLPTKPETSNQDCKMNNRQKIYQIVAQIPKGKVMTYGQIALKVSSSPRYVGWCLHHNPDHNNIPCHRVVNSQGKVAKTFAFGGGQVQQKMLEDEGVIFKNGRINLGKHLDN
jgi:methylated-DNA-protein-cysteine methyltransferase related protein